jgi:hypothetical protein
MAERRALIEGLKEIDENIDPNLAEQFIDGKDLRPLPKTLLPKTSQLKVEEPAASPTLPKSVLAAAEPSAPSPLTGIGRVPVGARVRTELAAALKRASLERQLEGIQPNSVQEILEDAIHLWLLKHGHLD